MKERKLIILGSGPAGLTAAIYAKRALLDPLVIEGLQKGGQIIESALVENYPGLPNISGFSLIENMQKQCSDFAIEFSADLATKVAIENEEIILTCEKETYKTKALIVATGASPKMLPNPSVQKFLGRGVSVCATCDGFFYRNKTVIVVGGGNTAITDALYLANLAQKVILVNRRAVLRAEKILVERLKKKNNVEFMLGYEISEVLGDEKKVTGVILKSQDGSTRVATDGLFIAIGHQPNNELWKNVLDLDENGYIKINCTFDTGFTQTSQKGIFAAGDVVSALYKQVVVAAGLGAMAGMDAEKYLQTLE